MQKGPSGTPPLATMAILSTPLATAHRWLHSLPPGTPSRVPERHVGGHAGARAQSGGLPRQAPCRGRCLVGSGSLSLTGPRDALVGLPGKLLLPGPCCLAGARGASRQVPWDALVGLPGKLLLPGPCLEYFVLEWLQRNHGGPWRSPGKPCRGALQLPVHKFGILGYPYSSTPTFRDEC